MHYRRSTVKVQSNYEIYSQSTVKLRTEVQTDRTNVQIYVQIVTDYYGQVQSNYGRNLIQIPPKNAIQSMRRA